MKRQILEAVIAGALLAWGGAASAQQGSSSYGAGGSTRCDSMSGEQKEQCLRDEGAKTQGSAQNPAGGGATSDASKPNQAYGQGGSSHCDTMTGDAKDKCLQDEARKGESEARKDASPATSKTGD